MNDLVRQLRILIIMALLFLIIGFLFAASSPDNVFIGVGFMIFSAFLDFLAIFPAIKIYKMKKNSPWLK